MSGRCQVARAAWCPSADEPGGPQAADEPLPTDSPGLPRRSDFWLALAIAVALFAILLHAGPATRITEP